MTALMPTEAALTSVHDRTPLWRSLKDTWRYRHFAQQLALSRIMASRTDNKLGLLWEFLNPLMTALVYYLAFGLVLGTRKGVENFEVFLLCGVFTWALMSGSLVECSESLARNSRIILTMRFPTLVLPLSVALRQLLTWIPMMAVVIISALTSGEQLRVNWLVLIPATLLSIMFGSGVGLLLAHLAARTRDVASFLPFTLRAWMFLSGVFYDPMVRFKHVHGPVGWFFHYNPASVLMEMTRGAFLHTVGITHRQWISVIVLSVVLFVAGTLTFWSKEGPHDA
jgi:teichoic acid transport system permease protein